ILGICGRRAAVPPRRTEASRARASCCASTGPTRWSRSSFSPSRRQLRSTRLFDDPARLAQQPCDLAIAVAEISLGKLDNIARQTLPGQRPPFLLARWAILLPQSIQGEPAV